MLKALATFVIEPAGDITVGVVWTGVNVDRPTTYGFGLPGRDKALAARLMRAINAQVVFTDPVLALDVNGKTYIKASCHVMGRHMEADLQRLGF